MDPQEAILKATGLKDEGAELFKQGDLSGALKKYHYAHLYVKGLVVGTDVSSFSALGNSFDKKLAKDSDKLPARDICGMILNNISLIHLKLENPQKALFHAEKSVEVNPTFKAYYRRACAYKAVGDLLKAEDDFQTCLGMDPENAAVKQELRQIELLNKKRETLHKNAMKKMFQN